MTTRTIKEVFRKEDEEEYGWFFPLFQNTTVMNSDLYPDWIRTDTELQQRIDACFFSVKSSDRVVSPFVERVARVYARNVIIPGILQLVPLHQEIAVYADKWDKIHSALLIEYNPLENYSMKETEIPNITKTGSINNSANSAANL